MKSKEEYLSSIYEKRDKKLAKRRKTVSVITSLACLAVCFIAVFSFVPKKIGKKVGTSESVNKSSYSYNMIINKTVPEDSTIIYQFAESFKTQPAHIINDSAESATYNAAENDHDGKTRENSRDDILKTEIATEKNIETTRNVNFGYIGEPFDPDKLLSGDSAISPEEKVTAVTGSDYKKPDSVDEAKTVAKTSAAKPKSSEEAVAAAKDFLQDNDAAEIIDEKTQVTVTRTSKGETKYNVYFYTENKSFNIEVDGITLRIISCGEKNLITGKESYISLPWFPETTEALPEYKPQ